MNTPPMVISSLLVKFNAVVQPANVAARFMAGYNGTEEGNATVVLLTKDNDQIVNPGYIRLEIPPSAFDRLYQSCVEAKAVLDLTKDAQARIHDQYKKREGIFTGMAPD